MKRHLENPQDQGVTESNKSRISDFVEIPRIVELETSNNNWETPIGGYSGKRKTLFKQGSFSKKLRRHSTSEFVEKLLRKQACFFAESTLFSLFYHVSITGAFFWLAAFVCVGIGIFLRIDNAIECKKEYTHLDNNLPNSGAWMAQYVTIDKSDCSVDSISQLEGEIYLYYEISNFHQNHRDYMISRSYSQLAGNTFDDASMLRLCGSETVDEDGMILHPCGLAARSVFNDSFDVLASEGGVADKDSDQESLIPLDEQRSTIVWDTDLNRFKNPSKEVMEHYSSSVLFWLENEQYVRSLHGNRPGVGTGVENSHFIVWMQNAAFSTFKKLYGKLMTEKLSLPVTVKIYNNYPTTNFSGRKYVVLVRRSFLGGNHDFLMYAYFVIGSIVLMIAVAITYSFFFKRRVFSEMVEETPSEGFTGNE